MVGSDPSTGFGLPARPRRERAQSVAQALTLREEGAAVERDQRPAGCLAQDGPVLGSVSPPRRRRARGTGVAASARDGRGPHPRPPATASDHVSSSLTACAAASSSHSGCWRGAVSVARRIASRAVGPLLPITLPTAAREPLPLPAATRPARAPLLGHDLHRRPAASGSSTTGLYEELGRHERKKIAMSTTTKNAQSSSAVLVQDPGLDEGRLGRGSRSGDRPEDGAGGGTIDERAWGIPGAT